MSNTISSSHTNQEGWIFPCWKFLERVKHIISKYILNNNKTLLDISNDEQSALKDKYLILINHKKDPGYCLLHKIQGVCFTDNSLIVVSKLKIVLDNKLFPYPALLFKIYSDTLYNSQVYPKDFNFTAAVINKADTYLLNKYINCIYFESKRWKGKINPISYSI